MPESTSERGLDPYRRGVTVAWTGLLIQALLLIALLLLQAYSSAEALRGLFWLSVVGCGIWALTALLQQLQLGQQIEQFELERLQREQDSSSMFLNAADAQPAQRRLASALRWGLPAASLAFGGVLTALGIILLDAVSEKPLPIEEPARFAALCGLAAFLGFAIGRYILGMASTAPWQLLRPGAVFLLGQVMLLFVCAAVLGLEHFLGPGSSGFMVWVTSAAVLVLGLELLFNQLLDFYRPRRRGETPRPAYDSRLLSLLASPETIVKSLSEAVNYQFGFEITRSWFWRLLARASFAMVLFGVLALLLLSSLVIVQPHQQALIVRWGRIVSEQPLQPGLHFKYPWPISTVQRFDVLTIRNVELGSHTKIETDKALLWADHNVDREELYLVGPPRAARARAAAGDLPAVMLVGAEILVQFRIGDVMQYARSHQQPEKMLADIADKIAARYFYRLDIDQLIGPARLAAADELLQLVKAEAERRELGLEVLWIGLAGIHPAKDVADAFHETVGAERERETSREQARQQATRLLVEAVGSESDAEIILRQIERLEALRATGTAPDEAAIAHQEAEIEAMLQAAGGEASRRIAEARAYRWQVENAERGRALRFQGERAMFLAAPEVFRSHRWLAALAESIPVEARKFLLATDRTDLIFRGDFKDITSILPPRRGD